MAESAKVLGLNEAVFLHGASDATIALFNLRECRPSETLVDVGAVGICRSDLHYYKDGGIGSAIIHEQFAPGPGRPLASPASE